MRKTKFADIPDINIFLLGLPDIAHDIIEGYIESILPTFFVILGIKLSQLNEKITCIKFINDPPIVLPGNRVSGKGSQVCLIEGLHFK